MDKFVTKINKLISRISKGDEKALNELFALTRRLLFFMAQKYLIDKSYAEDLLCETYFKVVKYSSTFDKTKNGLNWIFKILHNEAININKKHGAICECELTDDKASIEYINELLDKILVNDALKTLNEEERLDIKSIANKIGKPLSTTYDKLKNILKKLHNALK